MNGTEKGKVTVCVTGASGFIGSYLVKLSLLRGYIVHATVRDPKDGTKTDHLKALEGAREQLRLFKADLREEGSFDSAIAGCQGVFHTASPVNFNVSDERANELVLEPAVKGTLNVLSACKRTPSVRRVIFTSSMSAVLFAGKPLTHNTVVDETWFSDPQHCNVLGPLKWYVTSKIMAEEAAWKFSKENGIDMISMNPGSVIGPILQPTLNDSTAMFSNIIGAETYPNICLFPIHVEDVAEAHIRAFEIPSAQGRYCIVERSIHFSEIVKLLQELYPTLQFPKRAENEVLLQPCQVSKAKAESLGISYIPAEVSLKETIESLIEKKFIHL